MCKFLLGLLHCQGLQLHNIAVKNGIPLNDPPRPDEPMPDRECFPQPIALALRTSGNIITITIVSVLPNTVIKSTRKTHLHCPRMYCLTSFYLCNSAWKASIDTNVLVLLLSCAPGPPTPLSILVRASLHCSVKGVVHSIVHNLQFLANFSQGIAFISQNKNRLRSFGRKSLFLAILSL